ncbi:hypothetical protein LguiA_034433 [Lonicera macranthoides]
MVIDLYKTTHDMALVKNSLPGLLKEYKFWTSGLHEVKIKDIKGSTHSLSRYYAMWNKPRPESSTNEKETASKLSNSCEKQHLYCEITSTAESGWDFSTRWMRNGSDLTTLTTTSIIPYEARMELDIVFLANVTGESSTADQFM